MPYRVCKCIEIENAHMLTKHPLNCKYPHGHSRRIEFVLESDHLDENNMVCDFGFIRESVQEFLSAWDHSLCMNSSDPNYMLMKNTFGARVVGFENTDPTTEVMAEMLFYALKLKILDAVENPHLKYPIGKGVRVVRVRIWETSSSWAEYGE